MSARQVYSALLGLYPRDYATAFADEMTAAFERACAEHRQQGRVALVRFAVSEMAGLFAGAAMEWIAKLTTDSSVRGRCLPDLRKMRPAGVPRELWFGAVNAGGEQSSLPLEIAQAEARVTSLVNRIVHAIANHDFPAARSYSYEEYRERDNLRALRKKHGLEQ